MAIRCRNSKSALKLITELSYMDKKYPYLSFTNPDSFFKEKETMQFIDVDFWYRILQESLKLKNGSEYKDIMRNFPFRTERSSEQKFYETVIINSIYSNKEKLEIMCEALRVPYLKPRGKELKALIQIAETVENCESKLKMIEAYLAAQIATESLANNESIEIKDLRVHVKEIRTQLEQKET